MGYVLITGASSGIGKEFAFECARHGHNLILAARRIERLQQLCTTITHEFNVDCQYLAIDLSRDGSGEYLFNQVYEKKWQVDILFNNAGVGLMGEFADMDIDSINDQLKVNIQSLTILARLFAHEMKQRGSGYILNNASIAGFLPGPYMAVYYATKAYVLSLSDAMYAELKKSGVTVSVVCPGPTLSEFRSRAGMSKHMGFDMLGVQSGHEVARIAYCGMIKGKRRIVPGVMNKIAAFSRRFIPVCMQLWLIATMQHRALK